MRRLVWTILLLGSTVARADDPPQTQAEFDRGILPKTETGALRFLAEHPEYDGRGVVVAIFDTGVDPGATGLQKTTDGELKIVDLIDGTGSGDVKTSTIRKTSGGTLAGLTGRQLTIPATWKNPKGEYHLGWKRAYDLFPAELVSRLKRERHRDWDRVHRAVRERQQRELVEWDRAHASPSAAQRRKREELAARLQQLDAAAKSYDDPGPVFDCVVFHDGKRWRAAVDTDEDGHLDDETLLTNYRDEAKYATFSQDSLLNFTVNIFDNGNLLSLVTTCGAHGTHVAGIVAGHYPDQPERNGLAPGARIVSVKIGDTRLGSMETGAGLVRGLTAVLRNKCDLVNMSYGEPTSSPNRGRLPALFSELVNRHGVVFVASAGNAGPALSTVGAPGGTTSALLGVGAYVSPAMMRAEYTLRRTVPGMAYTWSSRGPTADGDAGVDIFAPGGAIAPVPTWTLQGSMQMNGTSMSSPNACGNLALLISGLKATKTAWSPTSIRRAIQNTATPVNGPAADGFGQGPGLLQVDRAWQYLADQATATGEQLPIEVSVSGGRGRRGIYLRDAHETASPVSRLIRIRPRFPEASDNSGRVAFQLRVRLESTAKWIACGQQILLTHGGNSFRATIDPRGLPPGAYRSDIVGFDAERPKRGPLFRVPVTLIRTSQPAAGSHVRSRESLAFTPGHLTRRFLDVPAGATWADLSLTLQPAPAGSPVQVIPSSDPGKAADVAGRSRRFVVHTVQLRPGRSFRQDQARLYLTLRPGAEVVRSIPVTPGRTLEICLAQYWSSLGTSQLAFRVDFHGIVPDHRSLTLTGGQPGTRVQLHNTLAPEQLGPIARVTTHRQLVSPVGSTITLLSRQRDGLTRNRQVSQLVLDYRFDQSKSGRVTPRFPDLDGLLYDSPLGTQQWMIFDKARRRVACDDMFPEAVQLRGGPHLLRLSLRHTSLDVLEKLKRLQLALDRPLTRPLTLGMSLSRTARVQGSTLRPAGLFAPGRTRSLFVVPPSRRQISSNIPGGDLLLGSITYGRADPARHGAGQRPGGFSLQVVVPPAPPSQARKPSSRPAGKLATEQRDFLVDRLKRISFEKQRQDFDKLAALILKKHPGHTPVLLTRLHRLDEESQRKTRLPEIVAAADALLATVDREKLARTLGTRGAGQGQKETLVDALYRKGRALAYMELPDVVNKQPIKDKPAHDKAFRENFTELKRWVDTTDKKYVLLHIRAERRRGRQAIALKWLNKSSTNSPPNYWYTKKRRDLYNELGWSHCAELANRWLLIKFPKDYEAF